MFATFLRYSAVGLLNTAVHWVIFLLLVGVAGLGQGLSNLVAFCCAVTFSFFVNARVTFRVPPNLPKYLAYTTFMGALAFGIGWIAERIGLPPLVTLVAFSAISLGVGFLFAQFVVFRRARA